MFKKIFFVVISVLVTTHPYASEWTLFRNDGLVSMIDVDSIKKYPGLVYGVIKTTMSNDLVAYQQFIYMCQSEKIFYGAPSTAYPESDSTPKPTTVWPQDSNDLQFSIHTYCHYSNNNKDDVEFPIAMTGDDTNFETLLLKENEIRGSNIIAWTTSYSVKKKLAFKMKDRDKTPVYEYKINFSEGYVVNRIGVNCTKKSIKHLESHRYNKSGKLVMSEDQTTREFPTIPKSHGRHIVDVLCSLTR